MKPQQRTLRLGTAVWDPGAVLKRGDNYDEPLPNWQTRAVKKVIADALAGLRLNTPTGEVAAAYMCALADVADVLEVEPS